jgi:hypothetical protein
MGECFLCGAEFVPPPERPLTEMCDHCFYGWFPWWKPLASNPLANSDKTASKCADMLVVPNESIL